MRLVIDAQVVKAYFQEDVLEMETSLTEAVAPLINRLGNNDQVFLDEGGQIAQEWRQLVEPEWLDAWLGDLLISDAARLIEVQTCYPLKKKLASFGFPTQGREGRDFWYIRTAKAVVGLYKQKVSAKKKAVVVIISEDIDFYEPKQKGKIKGEERLAILQTGQSTIGRYLLKHERIKVSCIVNYLYNISLSSE